MSWKWAGVGEYINKSFTCGYCGNKVAPHQGYHANNSRDPNVQLFIYICPNCNQPSYFDEKGKQTPSIRIGNDVQGITDEGVATLYNQARDCTSLRAYTAATLLCRKILMNLAVQHGDSPGKSFIEYIEYLDSKGYVPPNGKPWVDRIRTKGNEATHEIRLIEVAESSQILTFIEMLLKFSYEFPSMLKE
jgi:hypothetical protein